MIKVGSIRVKITLISVLLVLFSFVIMSEVSLTIMEKRYTSSLVDEFVNIDEQMACQAEYILKKGDGNDGLQAFVQEKANECDYIAYASVIDKDVNVVAHSMPNEIGKNYSDDVDYTLEAAANGKVMSSKSWDEESGKWTYDIMYPIYINDEVYGTMNVGIYNEKVETSIQRLKTAQLVVTVVLMILISGILLVSVNNSLKPFKTFEAVFKKLGANDFSFEVKDDELNRQDEFGTMGNSIMEMKKGISSIISESENKSTKLSKLITNLKDTIENSNEVAMELLENTSELSEDVAEQKTLSDSNLNISEDMSKKVNTMKTDVQDIYDISESTSRKATLGIGSVKNMMSKMDNIESNVGRTYEEIQKLKDMSVQIKKVVKLISGISSKTNMLALNASIEAAKAGEQGKGFVVVAGQVGELAFKSNEAAGEIEDIISQIMESVDVCVELMQDGNGMVSEGKDIAGNVNKGFTSIKSRVEKLGGIINELSESIEDINNTTTQFTNNTYEVSGISDKISENALEIIEKINKHVEVTEDELHTIKQLVSMSEFLEKSFDNYKI